MQIRKMQVISTFSNCNERQKLKSVSADIGRKTVATLSAKKLRFLNCNLYVPIFCVFLNCNLHVLIFSVLLSCNWRCKLLIAIANYHKKIAIAFKKLHRDVQMPIATLDAKCKCNFSICIRLKLAHANCKRNFLISIQILQYILRPREIDW